jgi:FKBP-type peptidyl-prolyl cis-trans isomerase (trigger factor)
VLDAVAEANKLYASEGDVDARIAELAAARSVTPAQLYTSLEKANRLRELEHGVTEEKTFAFLLGQSTVEETVS